MKVAVSFLKSDNYKKCIAAIDQTKADYIHVDYCDGKYVANKNFTISELVKLLKNAIKPLDIHLMVKEPIKYIDELAMLNVDTITLHIDACKDLVSTINYVRDIGIKVGLALNPGQNTMEIKPYLDIIDRVLIMSVVPGEGGQAFMPEVIPKLIELNQLKEQYNFTTSVDGGINNETFELLKDQDIDVIVSGSYVTSSEDYDAAIKAFKK